MANPRANPNSNSRPFAFAKQTLPLPKTLPLLSLSFSYFHTTETEKRKESGVSLAFRKAREAKGSLDPVKNRLGVLPFSFPHRHRAVAIGMLDDGYIDLMSTVNDICALMLMLTQGAKRKAQGTRPTPSNMRIGTGFSHVSTPSLS